jgi:hypothetical protein
MTFSRYSWCLLVGLALLSWTAVYAQFPAGSAFTYQGRLGSGGVPIDGPTDLVFSLWDQPGTGSPPTGGGQVGSAIPAANHSVSDGLFTVDLDFGADAFTGGARWLQVAVRSPAGEGSYTTLSPRQPVTGVPLALHALSAPNPFALDGPDGALKEVVRVDQAGGVRLGSSFAGSTVVLDQDSPGGPNGTVAFTRWQSFTAGETGELNQVAIRLNNYSGSAEINVRVDIFAGTGPGGTLLGSSPVMNLPPGTDTLQTFNIFNVSVVAGQAYTWQLAVSGGTTIWVFYSNSNPYPGGRADFGPTTDYTFQTRVRNTQYLPVVSITQTGRVGIGTTDPQQALEVVGRMRTGVIEVTGGADIAEPYDIAAAGPTAPRPGLVVGVDPDQVGRLRVTNRPYDVTVAGIISGANGINPGMLLRQEGTHANGEWPVATVGRAWCYCDTASGGPIRPGDLLTTSKTPGHAQKADPTRANGAILGKAMSSLPEGRGLVLVLVSLQ